MGTRVAALVAASIVCALVVASPAQAKRGSKRAPRPLLVVVLPSDGEGTGGIALKDALELELSTLDDVIVEDSLGVEADLQKSGPAGWQPRALSAILSKRKVDAVVRSKKDGGRSATKIAVAAYASDGQPRFADGFDAQGGPDATAARIVLGLKPALAGWRSKKPVAVPAVFVPDDDDEVLSEPDEPPKAKAGEASLFIDPETLESGRARSDEKRVEKPVVTAKPVEEPRKTKRRDPSDDSESSAPKRPRRALLGEDAAPDDDDDDGGDRDLLAAGDAPRRETLADIDAAAVVEPPRNTHLLSVAAAFEGATWQYIFSGAQPAQSRQVGATFFGGGSGRIDFWPIKYAGVDADGFVAVVPFKISSGGALPITPAQFTSYHFGGGIAAKGRWVFDNGVGIGGRLGYRMWFATVESQVVTDENVNLTVVPGYELHGLATGVELYYPITVLDRRLELEAVGDLLPLTSYKELPDNPGASSQAVGWNTWVAARYDVFSGVFVEAKLRSTGVASFFDGEGDRNTAQRDAQTGLFTPVQGGTAMNLDAGFTLGAGWMF